MHISKVGTFFKIQEICYQKGTKILKIDLEIAEIIEVKVGNHHLEIIHSYTDITQRQKNNFHVKGGNFDLNYLSYF